MAEQVADPAKKTLEFQLNSVRFLAGVEAGRWELQLVSWPYAYVRVTGKDPDTGCVFAGDFRLECLGFPHPGPLVERWAYAVDATNGSAPAAPPAQGSPGFVDATKNWGSGMGIYRAWSRHAAAHNNWAQKRPDESWHPKRDIVFIMEHLYALVTEQAVWLATRR